MSVCDLIAHRSEFDHRMVVVRGAVQGGDGAWLVASPDCEYKLIKIDHERGDVAEHHLLDVSG